MSTQQILDYTESKSIYVDRQTLLEAIESQIKNHLVPELNALKAKMGKIIKSRENALDLLIAMRRDKEHYNENTLYVDACLERIHAIELRVEDLHRTKANMPKGDKLTIRLTFDQSRYYGL